jgi:hypothetical protein
MSFQLFERPPYYSAFWHSVEDVICLDEIKEDDYEPYYNFFCSSENSGSERLQFSTVENSVDCYIPDDPDIISCLHDAKYIRNNPDVYINFPQHVILSYAFKDV